MSIEERGGKEEHKNEVRCDGTIEVDLGFEV